MSNLHPLIVRPSQIKAITGIISRTKAYELEKTDPTFPKKVRLGNSCGWRLAEIQEWLNQNLRGDTNAKAD